MQLISEREISVRIHSELYESNITLFNDKNTGYAIPKVTQSPEPQVFDMVSLATYTDDGKYISISYVESVETGLDGSKTTIFFKKDDPYIVSMLREGAVSTNLVFEQGKRCQCVYKTPYMPFELCVHTKKISNTLFEGGCIDLDYVVEIRGAQAERNKFKLTITSDKNEPKVYWGESRLR